MTLFQIDELAPCVPHTPVTPSGPTKRPDSPWAAGDRYEAECGVVICTMRVVQVERRDECTVVFLYEAVDGELARSECYLFEEELSYCTPEDQHDTGERLFNLAIACGIDPAAVPQGELVARLKDQYFKARVTPEALCADCM